MRRHSDAMGNYLRGVLGADAEGAGGRVGVADTLQEALLELAALWPQIQDLQVGERDLRMYGCLRDAAVDALRSEHGRRGHPRPLMITCDLERLQESGDEDLPAHERQLAAAVLGATARDVAGGDGDQWRGLLDRAILLAGLRALSQRELVVVIGVDHIGWASQELADELGITINALWQTLFGARKLLQGVIRHAAGVDLDEVESARLIAYQAGELTGAERRHARRHLQHCAGCQAMVREQHVFCESARQLLLPLPYVLGARILARPAAHKTAGLAAAGAGKGLLGQGGAVKALSGVVGVLGVGFGASAVLAAREHRPITTTTSAVTRAVAAVPVQRPMVLTLPKSHAPTRASRSVRASRRKTRIVHHRRPAVTHSAAVTASPTPVTAPVQAPTVSSSAAATAPPTASPAATPSSAPTHTTAGGGEFFGQ